MKHVAKDYQDFLDFCKYLEKRGKEFKEFTIRVFYKSTKEVKLITVNQKVLDKVKSAILVEYLFYGELYISLKERVEFSRLVKYHWDCCNTNSLC